MRGKIRGTMVALPCGPSFFISSTPKIISMAITRITNAPATAKDWISTPNNDRSPSPAKRNATKITNDPTAVWTGCITLPFFFKSIIIGIDPVISMIAKSTIKALTISFMLNSKLI